MFRAKRNNQKAKSAVFKLVAQTKRETLSNKDVAVKPVLKTSQQHLANCRNVRHQQRCVRQRTSTLSDHDLNHLP